MKYNYQAMRRKFNREQQENARHYRVLGMPEDSIQAMYQFDLAMFNSNRAEIRYAAELHEMMSYDRVTGEAHYMDMDEFPANAALDTYPSNRYSCIDEIENVKLHKAICKMSRDYIEIITLLMEGRSQQEIATIRGSDRRAINNKIVRIKKMLEEFCE